MSIILDRCNAVYRLSITNSVLKIALGVLKPFEIALRQRSFDHFNEPLYTYTYTLYII